MTRPIADYLGASPWEALLQLINDNCGLHLEPETTTLMSLEAVSDTGETKVTLTAPKLDNKLNPPFAYRVFRYYRLNLAEVLADYDGGFIDPSNAVVDTRWVVDWLSEKTGIPFDINDYQHVTVRNMETFTLKAHPMSLRWYGEISMTIAPSSDGARLTEPGTYRLRLKPGTYSVLMVGGGSGGTGRWFSDDDKAQGRLIRAAGGGSGFALKDRIVIKEGDSIVATVGAGSAADCPDTVTDWFALTQGGLGSDTTLKDGGDSILVQNKKEIFRAKGAHIAGNYKGPKPWTFAFQSLANGSCGASGGGRSGRFKGVTFVAGVPSDVDPGSAAGDGGSDGDNGQVLDLDTNGFPWTNFGSGGVGAGKGYYTNILNAIDPEITHDIQYGSKGGTAALSRAKFYYKGSLLGMGKVARAGGGGGCGLEYRGRTVQIDGVEHQIDGSGFGAGGGGGNPGVSGFISLVKIT